MARRDSRVRMVLAEYARTEDAGLFTVVRGGIDSLSGPLPFVFQVLYAFVEFGPSMLVAGANEWRVYRTAPGSSSRDELGAGAFHVTDPKLPGKFALHLGPQRFHVGGSWEYDFDMAGFRASVTVIVKATAPPTAAES